jgi:pimeloyl-ACP methyl ester carboxylesterase
MKKIPALFLASLFFYFDIYAYSNTGDLKNEKNFDKQLYIDTINVIDPQTNNLMDIKKGMVNIEGASLYYEIAGEGEPIILLHGHSLDCRMWDLQFMEFATKYKVIRYDLRGYGKSSTPEEGKPFLHVDDLMHLMQALKIEKAHIVGLSLGSYVATEFLLKYSQMALSVCAVSGTFYNRLGPETPYTEEEIIKRKTDIDKLKQLGIEQYKREWHNRLVNSGGSNRESMRIPLWTMINEWSAWQPLHIEPRLLLGRSVPDSLKIKKLSVPYLILQGEIEAKGKNTQTLTKIMLDAYPKAQYVIIPDAGHMVNMEKPSEFNMAILDFVNH